MTAYRFVGFFALLTVVFTACTEDDLKNASSISPKKITLTKDRTLGMTVTYSDSAVVKAKLYAPVYDKVVPAQGSQYNEMPEGVKIEFFDAYLQVTGTITSDYAINNETDQLTVFRKNVVVVQDRMTFTTEELTWDQRKKRYFSPSGTVTKDGNVLTGAQFSAPEDFSSYEIVGGVGQGYVKGDLN
ncbi:MAG: hypothetical protein EOO07_00515 [Chitinophagaceae bacterium]|nr:MAG: hypothetical protein EOO07_00515 [Chitinophagaceae bacterium]